MALYIVDDGGVATRDGQTWTNAYLSVDEAINTGGATNGDTILVGHNHIDQFSYVGDYSVSMNSGTAPLALSSVTQGTGSVAGGITSFVEQAATTYRQIDASNNGANAYTLSFAGNWHFLNMGITSGGFIYMAGAYYGMTSDNTTFAPAANSYLRLGHAGNGYSHHRNVIVDLNKDGTTERSGYILWLDCASITGLSFVNEAYRSGGIFQQTNTRYEEVSSADFSGLTHANVIDIFDTATVYGRVMVRNSKMPATYGYYDAAPSWRCGIMMTEQLGSGNAPSEATRRIVTGQSENNTTVYRTGGASAEGTAYSLGGPTTGIETTASANESNPFRTAWIYVNVASTGSKTFTVYIGNTQADLNNDEIWLEVEYKADVSSGKWTLDDSNKRADIHTAAAAQTDDTTSTWNGETMTYMQKLETTVTVNTTGLARCRVCVGKTSVTSTQDLYVDPLLTVT
jgi:hypothetical protein